MFSFIKKISFIGLLFLLPLKGRCDWTLPSQKLQVQKLEQIMEQLKSSSQKKVILDTDTYNEMDDQYAIAYALGASKINLLSINAAPFLSERSTSFGDGMEKSYQEILRVLSITGRTGKVPVYKGSTTSFTDNPSGKIIDSPAARNIINTAKKSKEPIYVLSIGACTNVASALTLDPSIKNKIVVIWVATHYDEGGNICNFNLDQDYKAGQILFDSGAPLILMPGCGSGDKGTQMLAVDQEKVKAIKGDGRVARFFRFDLPHDFKKRPTGNWWHILWDVAAPGIISAPQGYKLDIVVTPVLTDEKKYAYCAARLPMILMQRVDAPIVLSDLFNCISNLQPENH